MKAKLDPAHLSGLIAAPHTPMREDGRINLSAIERQAQLLVESGIRGAFICGSTGESHSLGVEERKRIAKRWVEVAGRRLVVIVHVGHNSQPEARTLAAFSQRIGADAIAAMAPCYYRPSNVDDLIDFYERASLLTEIDGTGSVHEVAGRILEAVAKIGRRSADSRRQKAINDKKDGPPKIEPAPKQ